jgi:hypothetical protein
MYTPLRKDEEEEKAAEIGKGRGEGALPTYNTAEEESLFYYKHTFFFTLRKRLLMRW